MSKFGGIPKVYASRETKPYYNFFVDEKQLFPSIVDLFHLCVAIGIWKDSPTPLESKDELLNVYTIDKEDIFETLLEWRLPDKSGEERLMALQEYAETGIRYLRERYDRDQRLDLTSIYETLPKEVVAVARG